VTLSDTIDFLAKNVQAGIVIDFDRPPQEDIGLGKNAGPRWLKWKTLGFDEYFSIGLKEPTS